MEAEEGKHVEIRESYVCKNSPALCDSLQYNTHLCLPPSLPKCLTFYMLHQGTCLQVNTQRAGVPVVVCGVVPFCSRTPLVEGQRMETHIARQAEKHNLIYFLRE